MIAVWLAGTAVASGTIWSVLRNYEAPPARATFLNFEPRPLRLSEEIERLQGKGRGVTPFAAFVGTSLFVYAVPSTPPTATLFPDAPADGYSVRLAKGGRLEQDIAALLKRAVEIGVRKVYVEINPMLEDFFAGSGVASDLAERLHFRILQTHNDMLEVRLLFDDLRARVGSLMTAALGIGQSSSPHVAREDGGAEDLVPVELENEWLGQGRQYDPEIHPPHRYKITLHSPRQPNEISAALALARKRKIDVIFVSMPRSETVVRQAGTQYELDYARLLDKFVERFGASVLRAGMYWPDDHFADRAHVNLKGRLRLMDLIRDYEAGRR